MTDDLAWKEMPFLPRIQRRLVEEGITFQNFFVTTAVCCPSRASILTGQYPHNHKVLTNKAPDGGFWRFWQLGREQSTIATWLASAGYRSGLIGKYMNGYPLTDSTYVPPGWAEWYASLDHYFDVKLNENGQVVDYAACCQAYETDVLTSKAIDFIRRAVTDDAPFFLYIAPFAPHAPADPAPRHGGAFADVQAPRSPSFNERDVSDKPTPVASKPLLNERQIDTIDRLFRLRLQSMLAVDEMVDSLVAVLEAEDLISETYIFFTSDNGFHLGEHRLQRGKAKPYDEDVRVPLIVRGPGLPAGRTETRFVVNIDIAPTIADLAGQAAGPLVDGRSFVPLLYDAGSDLGWREGFLIERLTPLGRYRGVRSRTFLYVEYLDRDEFELYERRSDPFELENVYSSTDLFKLFRLKLWVDQMSQCSGEGCRIAENRLPGI